MATPDKPLDQMTAQERLDLGISYFKEGKFDEAIKVWSSIRREEADPKTYAKAQLNLGAAYYAQGNLDDAITAWSNIRREDDPETYARAQFNLGLAYKAQGKLDDAITAWKKVREDNPETYAKAQLNLGVIYKDKDEDQRNLDEAITAWSNIRRDNNPETYADAQFNLGAAYYAQGKLDDAITAWKKVREDNPETYAQAQLNLGAAYHAQEDWEQAIEAWSNIRRDDDPEAYADAQFNLGNTYKDQGNPEQAIEAWSNIRRDDDPETYAWAQFNLGNTYKDQGEPEQAIEAWSNIHREEVDPETYAQAQLNLGAAYYAQGNLDEAITAWKKVREDNPETYAKAQLNLGVIYKDLAYKDKDEDQRNLDEAITAWKKVREEADPETYAKAQLNLGEVYSLDKEKEEQSYEAYNNAQEFSYYKPERGFKILKCPQKIRKDLHTLAESTDEVLKYLQIIPAFESKVAHYTRPQIAFDLFEGKKNDKEPSNFRLSTIRGVNDPTEGLVLNGYWDQQGIPETIHTNDTATFISCFTFNHDNLNQFRLYGKENGREATGVSLVFNKEFFSNQADTLEFIAGPSIGPSRKSEQSNSNKTGKMGDGNKKKLIGKSTLYRCIYLDPETGYWTLAQRDKSTFYREDKEKETAENNWIEYSKKISKIEESFKDHLFDNNDSILEKLKTIFKDPNEYGVEEKQKILEAVRFILLPLQYLVKHIAFQEEQECRIMYITQFRDEKIHSNREEQKMYVEYKEKVLPHIDKIWLSPGAAKDQDFFRILLDQGSGKSKVRISQNPFRNKE